MEYSLIRLTNRLEVKAQAVADLAVARRKIPEEAA